MPQHSRLKLLSESCSVNAGTRNKELSIQHMESTFISVPYHTRAQVCFNFACFIGNWDPWNLSLWVSHCYLCSWIAYGVTPSYTVTVDTVGEGVFTVGSEQRDTQGYARHARLAMCVFVCRCVCPVRWCVCECAHTGSPCMTGRSQVCWEWRWHHDAQNLLVTEWRAWRAWG